MIIRFLEIDENEAYLLGYELKLSPTERKILFTIAKSESITADALLELLPTNLSRGNITVHICSINKKARLLSGRKLVLYEKGSYKLNPYM